MKITKIYLATLLSCILILSGCQTFTKAVDYTVNATTVASSIKYLDKNLDQSLKALYTSDFYTEEEKTTVERLVVEIDYLLAEAESILANGSTAERLVKAKDLNKLILMARSTYLETEALVSRNFDKYPPEQQAMFRKTRDTLVDLDKAWIKITTDSEGEDVTHVITGVLSVVGTMITLIEPYTKD
jgi:hypothetical protein